MPKWKIYNEDAVEWARHYSKAKFHALLCDAPYHLTSITKRYSKTSVNGTTKTEKRARDRSDGMARFARGFMGTQWDGGDLAFRPETWEAFGEVLHPGAFGMAFSASRNWHRMAVAIEDAGFILHPTIFLWGYGQGFPKATRVKSGNFVCPECKGKGTVQEKYTFDKKAKDWESAWGSFKWIDKECPICKGKKEVEPSAWEGHRYGLQALKPAVEPIIVFQKPYEGKPIDDIVETGAGALNIDGGRVVRRTDDRFEYGVDGDENQTTGLSGIYGTFKEVSPYNPDPAGRWPANLILDGESAKALDAQTGNLPAGTATANSGAMGYHGGRRGSTPEMSYKDNGGASRFFYNVSTKLDESDPVYYCAKVSPKERNAGLDDLPETLGGSLDGGNDTRNGKNKPQLHSTKNNHPTLKPIDLMRYLATLLLPPIEYAPRRIFVPFSGVASEMIGAGLAGWEHIVGVENDTENNYVEIAEKRLEHWLRGR